MKPAAGLDGQPHSSSPDCMIYERSIVAFNMYSFNLADR